MAKYSENAQKKVKRVMEEYKEGKLRSSSGQKVNKRDQAIAIALSEARASGTKVPPPPGEKSSSASKSSSGRKSASKR